MGKAEINNFIILATIILLIFIVGIIVFILQYHKRKLAYEKEKAIINEQHIQDLLNTKLEIQSQTMADVGREIHDNIGQRLTLASINANKLLFENQYPAIKEQVAEISKVLNESLNDLRSISKNLTNISAEVVGFRDIIENECKRVNNLKMCTAACYFNTTDFTISTNKENFLLRIIQEFMQNSLKHSNCKNIRIDFNYTDKGLEGTVQDDGVGFNMDHVARKPKPGIGLSNMKKRAELMGASYSLNSVINEGTSLHIFIPIDKLNAS